MTRGEKTTFDIKTRSGMQMTSGMQTTSDIKTTSVMQTTRGEKTTIDIKTRSGLPIVFSPGQLRTYGSTPPLDPRDPRPRL